MTFSIIVSLGFVVENFESILWMGFIMDDLVFSIGIHERVPAFHVSIAV